MARKVARKSKAKPKRKSRTKAESPKPSRPTLLIDSKKLSGNSFKVGKKATVRVTGKIVEESLRDWEAKGKKSFRLEIAKIESLSKRKK